MAKTVRRVSLNCEESEIGALLKKSRLEKKMTQAQVAKKVGVSKSTVSKWEKTGDISIGQMSQYTEVMKCDFLMELGSPDKTLRAQSVCDKCDKHCYDRLSHGRFRIVFMCVGNDCPFELEHTVSGDGLWLTKKA